MYDRFVLRMDKGWMTKNRLSQEYEDGINSFLNYAIENGKDPNAMCCPCVKCGNLHENDVKTIRAHLIYNGVDLTYVRWIHHGEMIRPHTDDKAERSTPDRDFYSNEPVDRHLYKECVNTNLIDRFRFINPYAISHNPKVDSTEKATIVGKRLIGSSTNQLVFVPCNVGFHWILMVVDPHKEIVYVMDPLSNNCHFDEWKSIMEMAMKIFNMSIGKRTRQNILWEVIMCQQQPDEKQCRFYVMRYMKDIIENRDSLPIALLFTEGFYLKREIDEVRTEWCGILQQFIDC